MTLQIAMLAPNANPDMNFTTRQGNSYASDAYGVVKNVTGTDVLDLLGADCIPLGQLGARSNFTATTNPGVNNDNTQDYAVGSHWLNKSTGVEWVATSVGTGAASWTPINGSYLGLPWVTGGFYGYPPSATVGTLLLVASTIYAYPLFVPSAVTVASLSVDATTGQTGANVRFGLYADTGAGAPGALVSGTDSGTQAATSNGVITNGSLSVALTPGWYWAAVTGSTSGTMATVASVTAAATNSLPSMLGFDTIAHAFTQASEMVTGVTAAFTFGALPSTFPSASYARAVNAQTPLMVVGV